MKKIDMLSVIILIIAGLIFGIRGVFDADLLGRMVFSKGSIAARVIDIVFGVAAVYQLLSWKRIQKRF